LSEHVEASPKFTYLEMLGSPRDDVLSIWEYLPYYSWYLRFGFQPIHGFDRTGEMVSAGSDGLVLCCEPFGVTRIQAEGWKAQMRWAAGLSGASGGSLKRLFGSLHPGDLVRGALQFFPTFFSPGNGLEDVAYSRCLNTFDLVYIPATNGDPAGRSGPRGLLPRTAAAPSAVVEDLRVVASALDRVMFLYGFSADRSKGYGLAGTKLVGKHGLPPGELFVALPPSAPRIPSHMCFDDAEGLLGALNCTADRIAFQESEADSRKLAGRDDDRSKVRGIGAGPYSPRFGSIGEVEDAL